MNASSPATNEQDKYIKSILKLLSDQYYNVEALRGHWVVTFIYYQDGTRNEAKIKKTTLDDARKNKKLPLTIKNLLK